MPLLLETDVARLDQPGHYRARASRLGGLFVFVLLVWSVRFGRGDW